MTLQWVAQQITSTNTRLVDSTVKFNPRPKAVIQPGSATEAVRDFLLARPTLYFAHRQIVAGTGRTGKAVDWALIFLKELHLVECIHDSTRNSRYLRYRITKKEPTHGHP